MADQEILVLRHQEDAGPGNLGSWLSAKGLPWRLVDVTTEELPAPRRLPALVVLGSREAAYDEAVPWLAAEREFVRASADAGTPVLGLCFGAQLLAQVRGGSVHRAEHPERGWAEVAAVAGSAFAKAVSGWWFEWHGDEIVAPPSATVLAAGRCVQAFTDGPHLGVQFHPEITQEQVGAWLTGLRRLAQLQECGRTVEEVLRETAERAPAAQAAAERLYTTFFAGPDTW